MQYYIPVLDLPLLEYIIGNNQQVLAVSQSTKINQSHNTLSCNHTDQDCAFIGNPDTLTRGIPYSQIQQFTFQIQFVDTVSLDVIFGNNKRQYVFSALFEHTWADHTHAGWFRYGCFQQSFEPEVGTTLTRVWYDAMREKECKNKFQIT